MPQDFDVQSARAAGYSDAEIAQYLQSTNRNPGMDLPYGTAQAGRWFGGGELTGLLSPRGDYLDMLEKQAAYTLHGQGRPTDPASVRRYILDLMVNGGDMRPWYGKNDPMPDYRTLAPGQFLRSER